MAEPLLVDPRPGAARAPQASDPDRTRGRLFREPESPTRTAFQRDRDRIVHATAFRRLMHKTQVFVSADGDHFRTRLTHSLEVAQIARSIARALRLDEDLAEAIALAHDFGHPPFGHEGEEVLDRLMADHGGFDHNAQTYRVVTKLERRYAAFDGLNLTFETREGLVKHNGPLLDGEGRGVGAFAERPLPHAFLDDPDVGDLELSTFPSLEAQVAAISDDIAYDAHDIDDGLRSGLLAVEAIEGVPLVGDILAGIRRAHPGLADGRLTHELVRRLLTALIEDVIAETRRRVRRLGIDGPDAVRAAGLALAGFSEDVAPVEREVKRVLARELYGHAEVREARRAAGRIVEDLFGRYMDAPDLLPEDWKTGLRRDDPDHVARRVCDYISGMTDRFARREHQRLVGDTPAIRQPARW